MDGSDVTVVIVGDKGVGKTTFIEHCFLDVSGSARLSRHAKVPICGREVSIRMVDNPGRSQLVPAMMVIVLFDLTNKETFEGLHKMLKLAQRVSPVALKAVVGTKADIVEERKVESKTVVSSIIEFCREHSEGTQTIPYYETALIPNTSIFVAFQEIIGRPLINDYVIKAATEQEQMSFAHEVMEWAIQNNSANILSHLRQLGYPIPMDIIKTYPKIIREYLLGEYPLQVIPQFTHVDLPPPNLGFEDSSLLEDFEDELQGIHDIRPTIEVMRTYSLCWREISLYYFLPEFLSQEVMDIRWLAHIDLSHNCLVSLPARIFKLPRLQSLNISHNQLTSLPSLEVWHHSSQLQVLNASHNHIVVSNHTSFSHGRSNSSDGKEQFHELWYLDLSDNMLTSFPMFVFCFRRIHYLDISHNTQITKLPIELGRLKNLVTLGLNGLNLFHPPLFVVEQGTAAILDYMRGKLEHSSPWGSMRVVVIGSKGSGKTSLVKKLRGDGNSVVSTKGLDVSEWKFKGGDLLSFRNKVVTFDMWDFTGDPDYRCIYSCFDCSNSLHLVVCKATDPVQELVKWLSDIQSRSKQRVPVVLVFSHMDLFRTREQKEMFKKRMLNWISYHSLLKGDKLKGLGLSTSSMVESVQSVQGCDTSTSSYEAPPEAFEMQEVAGEDIPLMPLVIKTLFISCSTGENLSNVRKLLYKIASTGHVMSSSSITHFSLVGQEVPTSYVSTEQLIRQLRVKVQQSSHDGKRPAFYTLAELKECLCKELRELNISDAAFSAALKFLHEVGVIYVYQCRGSGPLLVSVDLQIVGSLLRCTLRANCTLHTSSSACYLANTHLAMIWGVEQIILVEPDEQEKSNKPSSQNLLDYLYHLDICSPLFPGTSLIPSTIPASLPKGSEPDPSSLISRRVYILNYMPSLFGFQLVSRLVSALMRDSVPSLPISPSQTAPPPSVPLNLPSGIELYLWRRNVFVVDPTDGSKFWVRVQEGKLDSGGEAMPYAGRVDVQVGAGKEREVKWLRLVTGEIDHLIRHDYPSLLDTQRCVEVCVALSTRAETTEETSDSSDLELSGKPPPPTVVPISDITHSMNSASARPINCAAPAASHLESGRQPGTGTQPGSGSQPVRREECSETESVPKNDSNQSWEVLSKNSSTSTLLTMRQDESVPGDQLIPLWECLQEAFKTPVVRVGSLRIKLQEVIPELLFNDFTQELLFRTTLSSPDTFLMSLEEHMSGGIPPAESTGRFLRLYYTQQEEDCCLMKPAGASKASRLDHLRYDFFRLRQLQSPYLVMPVGVNFSPPCLAVESAPHGSLHQLLRGGPIKRNIIHHIALQLLAGLEFLHIHRFHYHSISSRNVLVWTLDPICIKMSDSGITHPPSNCNLCSYLSSIPVDNVRRSTSQRIDYILLGLLVFEMATGKAPYEGIYPLNMVVRAILHNKLKLSIEAQHFLQYKLQESSEGDQSVATGCQRLCLQSTMEECVLRDPVNHREVKSRFSLCAGDHLWSPMRMLANVECMLCSEDAQLVYWASGSRGLVTGTIAPATGHLDYNILQAAPPPESGLFADRRCKPVPIAVGRATGLALVQETGQLWVSTENGQMGSVYVFNLPDMRRHHYIHLQDAALCVLAINNRIAQTSTEDLKYRALVGLANGTIILFLGVSTDGGRVLDNPLQGPKRIVVTQQRRPCLSLSLTPTGHVWCSCGDAIEVLNATTLKLVRHLAISEESLNCGRSQKPASKGDVITLMAVNGRGVWTVGRRSRQLKLWDQVSAAKKGSFTVVTTYDQEKSDITALAVQAGVVWLGTRNGYILVLDAAVLEGGGDPLLGLQFCGEGKVRCIIPLCPQKGLTTSLEVICSVEFQDEVSGMLLCWEYLSSSRPANHPHLHTRSTSVPIHISNFIAESTCLDLREQCKSFSPTSF